jgi:hypothetical protein
MEEALKSILLINKNCELTEELATWNDQLADMADFNRLLVDCLRQFEFGNGLTSSPPDTGDDAMVVKSSGRTGEGSLPNDDTISVTPGRLTSPADAGDEEMVVKLRGGGGNGALLNNTSSVALSKSDGFSQGISSSPQQFIHVLGILLGLNSPAYMVNHTTSGLFSITLPSYDSVPHQTDSTVSKTEGMSK